MTDGINHSPVPAKTVNFKTMDFPEAIRKVAEGKEISRIDWNAPNSYYFLRGGSLMVHKQEEGPTVFHLVLLNDGDLLATDWVVRDDLLASIN